MRALIVCTCLAASAAFAQTEEAALEWARQGQQQVAAGQLSELEFYKELHRRISLTPSSAYPYKAENLRIVGRRVDIWEDVAAGKITRERAMRMLAEQQAEWEAQSQARENADSAARWEAIQAQQQAQAQAEAQQEAQRRALVLQMLQNQQQVRPIQIQPYVMPPAPVRPQVNCTSYRVGNTVQTDCR